MTNPMGINRLPGLGQMITPVAPQQATQLITPLQNPQFRMLIRALAEAQGGRFTNPAQEIGGGKFVTPLVEQGPTVLKSEGKIIPLNDYNRMKKNTIPPGEGKGKFMIVDKIVDISEIDVTGKTLDVARKDIKWGEWSTDKSNIVVRQWENGSISLVDGRHRLVEAIDRGDKTIKVDVRLPEPDPNKLRKAL